MDTLIQLGNLFVQAIPTVILVFLFYLFLRWAFFRPMEEVLAERSARTEGARQQAEEAKAAAEEKIRERNEAMKAARAAVYAEQDARRRVLLEQRAARIRAARQQAQAQVAAAKDGIAQQTAVARRQIEAATPALGTDIVQTLLGVGS